jgi:serine/threonine protein kinase
MLCCADLVLKGLVRVEDILPIDEKVDVWSFGVTVYELVTGAHTLPPQRAGTALLLRQQPTG